MAAKSYRELVVWQKAVDLVEEIYRVTSEFPRQEMYALTTQMRRAAVSIPSNIAEGQGRQTTKDFLHFLAIARGSSRELETQCIIAQRLGYMNQIQTSKVLARAAETDRLIGGLMRALRERHRRAREE